MNQYAGGWWLAQLWTMIDPDAVSFRGDFWFAPNNFTQFASMDGRSRVAKAVVKGGMFENGDDLSNATSTGAVCQVYVSLSQTGLL